MSISGRSVGGRMDSNIIIKRLRIMRSQMTTPNDAR